MVCLQETMCKNDYQSCISKYKTYHRPRPDGARSAGGVITAVKEDIDSESIDINTSLEAVAVKVGAPINANILNIYLPPGKRIQKNEILDLLSQISKPFILVGDLNAHHPLWGSSEISQRGKIIESVIDEENLVLLNNGENTYVNSNTGMGSCIDICCCSDQLAGSLELTVSNDSHGSDHIPLILSMPYMLQEKECLPKWKIEEADWEKYRNTIEISYRDDVTEQIELITRQIIKAAEQSIPKTKGIVREKQVPWWNNEVASAVKARRKALRNLQRSNRVSPNPNHTQDFRESNIKAQEIIMKAKKKSWDDFVQKFNVHTPAKELWNNYSKIQGKYKSSHIREIKLNNQRATNNQSIVDSLAKHFGQISSDKEYTHAFRTFKNTIEKSPPTINQDDRAEYNTVFSKNELEEAMEGLKGSSPGPDGIHYAMITNLPIEYKNLLLKTYNGLWESSIYPEIWTKSIVVPIYKGKGERNCPGNYRPIYLNSCLGKIFERMINNRLMHIIEERKLINEHQFAFRKGKSTSDYLALFDTTVREAMHKKLLTQAIFLDIRKAYDTTWRRLILNRISEWKIGGNLTKYIQKMLEKRTFRVKANGTLSKETEMENGLCQGSVISVTLFLIAIDTICLGLPSGVKALLFADDVVLIATDTNQKNLFKKLQSALKWVETWEQRTGFKISTEKCATVVFKNSRSRKQKSQRLKINCEPILEKSSHKCLGVTLDQHLTYKTHIEELKATCIQRIQFLRFIASRSWGGDRQTLIKIYKATILEKMLYAAPVTSSISDAIIGGLESVHNKGLRIITGAFHTSPIVSIRAETGIPSIRFLLNQRLAIFATKENNNNRCPSNEETEEVSSNSSGELWNQTLTIEPNTIRSRSSKIIEDIEANIPATRPLYTPTSAPWQRKKIVVDNSILSASRNGKNNIELRKLLTQRLHTKYRFHSAIYTDGSKTDSRTGFSVIVDGNIIRKRTHNQISIYSVESMAIIEALRWISNQERVGSYIICTDSLSVINSLEKKKIKSILKDKIINLYNDLISNGTFITFCWIPSHIGIPGNEKADKEAKQALKLNTVTHEVVDQKEIKTIIKSNMTKKWQMEWESIRDNKLRECKNTIIPYREVFTGNRRDDIVLTRLRIGHTHLTHAYILDKTDPPKCSKCNQVLTIKHIIVNCPGYDAERRKIGLQPNIREALADDSDQAKKVLNFFKEIALIDSI